MNWLHRTRSLVERFGARRATHDVGAPTPERRTFFSDVNGRQVQVSITADTPEALHAALETDELTARAAGRSATLRGITRVNGRLVSLHELTSTDDHAEADARSA